MFSDLRFRVRALISRKAVEREMDDELEFHVAHQAEKLKQSGISDEEAARQARMMIGGVEQVREECRQARGVAFVEGVMQDISYAIRVLRKSPVFTAAVSLSLALGIGANTAMFSIIDAVMWRMLPVREPEKILLLTHGQGTKFETGFTFQQYQAMRQNNQVLEDIAVWSPLRLSVSIDGVAQSTVAGQIVSGAYFKELGVTAIAGRNISAEDDMVPRAHPVTMISYAYWKSRFALDPSAIGRTISIAGSSFTVIGVTPPEFFGLEVGSAPDIFVPAMMQPVVMPAFEDLIGSTGRYLTLLNAFGRLKPGIHPLQATAQLEVFFRQEIPRDGKFRALENEKLALVPAAAGISDLRREFSQPLYILMTLVGMVLLIACANTANLLLARAATRQPEFAMRAALGAGRSRLMRQLLVESLILSLIGGALGIAIARWMTSVLLRYISSGTTPITLDLNPDTRVLGFTLTLSIVTGILFGIVPAIRATRFAIGNSLKDLTASHTGGRRSLRSGKILAVVQVSLSRPADRCGTLPAWAKEPDGSELSDCRRECSDRPR